MCDVPAAGPVVTAPEPITDDTLREAVAEVLRSFVHADDHTEARDPALAARLANQCAARAADAALAVVRGQQNTAVERVLALADEYDEMADVCQRVADGHEKPQTRSTAADQADEYRVRAMSIRAAVAGSDAEHNHAVFDGTSGMPCPVDCPLHVGGESRG